MARTILIVDDEEITLKFLTRLLEQELFSCVCCTGGAAALRLVEESPPALILLDARLPGGLDGHAVCRKLKMREQTRTIPIIMMSGVRIEEKDIVSGYEGGADDYILKAFSVPVLLAKIQATLRLYE